MSESVVAWTFLRRCESCLRKRLLRAACQHRSCGSGEALRPRHQPSCDRFELPQEVSIGVPVSIWKQQIVRLGIPLSHSVLDLPNQLRRDRNESVLGRFLFLLALQAKMAPRLRLYMQRAFFPVEVGILG